MSSVNKIILVGHLGTDPEHRYTSGGRAMTVLSLATNYSYTDQDNVRQERVSWHRVVLWGRQAELAKEHLHKGRQVYIEGRLETRSYEDREGQKRYITEVVGTSLVFLGSRGNGATSRPSFPVPTDRPESEVSEVSAVVAGALPF